MDLQNKHFFNTWKNLYNLGSAHSWFGRTPITMIPYSRQESDNIIRSPQPHKKGGRIRSTHEQYFLDQNKATHKALSKLDDNIFKLLMKMMS